MALAPTHRTAAALLTEATREDPAGLRAACRLAAATWGQNALELECEVAARHARRPAPGVALGSWQYAAAGELARYLEGQR